MRLTADALVSAKPLAVWHLLGGGLGLLVVLLFVVHSWAMVASPLRFDETEFYIHSLATLRYGVPAIPFDEFNWFDASDGARYDRIYGLWHPPLYVYSLAAAMSLLGSTTAAAREFGILTFGVTATLAVLIVWRCLGLCRKQAQMAILILATLLITTPILTQGIAHLDIDNTVMAALVLAFVYIYLQLWNHESRLFLLAMGIILVAMLWCKLTTAPLVLMALGLHALITRRAWLAASIGAIAMASLGCFLVTWYAYSILAVVPFDFPFVFTLANKGTSTPSTWSWILTLRSIRWHVDYLGISMVLLAIWAGGDWRRFRRSPGGAQLGAIAMVAVTILASYIVLVPTTGKYTFPGVLCLMLLVSVRLSDELYQISLAPSVLRQVGWLAAILIPATLLAYLMLRYDLVGSLPPALNVLDAAGSRGSLVLRGLITAAAPLVASIAIVLWVMRRRISVYQSVLLASAITVVTANLAQEITDVRLGYSPYTGKEEVGLRAVTEVLNARADHIPLLLAPKEIGFMYRGPFAPLDGAFARHYLTMKVGTSMVDSLRYPNVIDPESRTLRDAEFELSEEIGDFGIWQRRAPVGD